MGYKVQIPCKTCGKMFTPCATCVSDNTAFHWRAVACSPECAKKYFEAVDKAREKENRNNTKENNIIDGNSNITKDIVEIKNDKEKTLSLNKTKKKFEEKESELNRDMGV